MGKKKIETIHRDLSWLSFNERVLQEAEDSRVPLLERIKFLGIFSNNRDEFFRVRVATIRRMERFGRKGKQILGEEPQILLDKILKIVLRQQQKFDRIYNGLIRELAKENILLINEKQLNKEQGDFVRNYFHEQVYPFWFPSCSKVPRNFPT